MWKWKWKWKWMWMWKGFGFGVQLSGLVLCMHTMIVIGRRSSSDCSNSPRRAFGWSCITASHVHTYLCLNLTIFTFHISIFLFDPYPIFRLRLMIQASLPSDPSIDIPKLSSEVSTISSPSLAGDENLVCFPGLPGFPWHFFCCTTSYKRNDEARRSQKPEDPAT